MTVEIDQRVQFLDSRQPPVGVAAQGQGAGPGAGRFPGDFRAGGLLPHEARHEVGDRAVAVVHVSGGITGDRCVLTGQWLAFGGAVNRIGTAAGIIAAGLPGIHDRVRTAATLGAGHARRDGGGNEDDNENERSLFERHDR